MANLLTAAISEARNSHYELNPVTGLYERALLLEESRTNLITNSRNGWGSISPSVTAVGNAVSLFGGVAYTITNPDISGSSRNVSGGAGVYGSTAETLYVILEQGTAAETDLNLYDGTAPESLIVRLNWAAETAVKVTGPAASVIHLRKLASVGPNGGKVFLLGVTRSTPAAGNNRSWLLYPSSIAAVAGSVILHHIQLEVGAFPSSPIPTTTAAVTRAADALSFPFTLPPQEMTVYVKFIERGTILGVGTRILHIGAGGDSGAFLVYASSNKYAAWHHNGVGSTQSTMTPAPSLGDMVELRAVLHADGTVTMAQAIGGAAEVVAPRSAVVRPLLPAWSVSSMSLNARLDAMGTGFNAFQSVKVARGTKTLYEMRSM